MNSQLYTNENGRVAMDAMRPCTEASTAHFALPSSPVHAAELFILATKIDENAADLAVSVNGQSAALQADLVGAPCWLRTPLDADSIQAGDNEVIVPAQPGWEMAYEAASGQPVIRLRAWNDEAAPDPIFPEYGDPAITANRDEWLALLPEHLREARNRQQWCFDLAGFMTSAWPYLNEMDGGIAYAPWDARTILRWGRARQDDSGAKCIAMCVHYAICFVQFCIALDVPARAVILTSGINTPAGHFVAEVWLEEYQSWAMIDPNLQLWFRDPGNGRPLSAAELARLQEPPRPLAQQGEAFQQHERLGSFLEEECLSGNVYKYWGVWRRHDWIARPDLAPPAHGALPYAETDIIWCAENEDDEVKLAMFPHFLSAAQLATGPN